MSGKVFFILLSFPVFFSFNNPDPRSFGEILSAYKTADRLYNATNFSEAASRSCIRMFTDLVSALEVLPYSNTRDSLICLSAYKLGILQEVDKNYTKATAAYLTAMKHADNSNDKFRMLVFSGTGYYSLNNFDSASFFLLKAAEMTETVGIPEDRIRLYNSLGVLYYDNGNYLQSKNYFSQALRLINRESPRDTRSSFSVQLNMATCYFKLGLYDQALTLYRPVVGYAPLSNPLYLNMGRTYAALHRYPEALASFRKVNWKNVPGVLNEMAKAAMETGQMNAAREWINVYQVHKKSLQTNLLDDGINELYSGELEANQQHPENALAHLQKAMIIFSGNFSNPDIRTSPQNFTGSFAYYRLFEVLVQKSRAWEMVYENSAVKEDLKAAYDSYQSALTLLSYIERSYEMDDSKILLKQKSGETYQRAMEVCIKLSRLYPGNTYIESAFLMAEKNKASIMTAQIRERGFVFASGNEKELESEERNIRFNIARLTSLIEGSGHNPSLQKLMDKKVDFETRLVGIHRKMESNNRFFNLRYSDDFPSIPVLQHSLAPDQALISFFNTPEKVEVFVLTKSNLKHTELDNGIAIRQQLDSFIRILQHAGNGRHVKTSRLMDTIYRMMMKPVLGLAGEKEEWIIVPDGIFFMTPLEALPLDSLGTPVLEKHVVSYEFSARFLQEGTRPAETGDAGNRIFSFAPFSDQGAELPSSGLSLEKLTSSKIEISGLEGKRFFDAQASKKNFMDGLGQYPVLHLATHAVTDLDNPSSSFIAFYPVKGKPSDDFLYLDEIYSLRLDSCRMVVISACETGTGEFVHNEGVMSFARAFLYAGCPSTINTLWKADDHSTSEIIRLFYKHLLDGETKSRALRNAKLDFLHESPLYRDPVYWSHIVLTGDSSALGKKKQPWIWAAFAISCGTMLFITVRKKKRKKVDAFHSAYRILNNVV